MTMDWWQYEIINGMFFLTIYGIANLRTFTNLFYQFTGAFTVPLDLMIMPGLLYYHKNRE